MTDDIVRLDLSGMVLLSADAADVLVRHVATRDGLARAELTTFPDASSSLDG